ncbi:MAG: InlB B-repeat-containing protein [Kiritimatiellia bacterium]
MYETVVTGIVVTATAGERGFVSPATSIINSGGSVTLTADTNTYRRAVASWFTNGVVVASATNSTLTLTNILSHTDVTVAFECLDWYVDAATGNDDNAGDSWSAALKTIQTAIDRAASGETIYVKPGTYGAIDVDGKRLAITGVNGAGTTFIDANKASRAVTLCDGAAITGFTICNGDLIKLSTLDSQGGGVWGGTIRDCVISNNFSVYGGGAAGATVDRCVVVGNMASEGGGLYECKVFNSLLHKNDALQGGGCKRGTATGCTIVNNRAVLNSATDRTILRNCILTSHGTERRKENLDAFLLGQENFSGNLRTTIGLPDGADLYSHICSRRAGVDGQRLHRGKPVHFVDPANGDYRLRASSPCLNTGFDGHVKPQYNKDLAGNDRVTGSAPDMGCLEGGVAGHVVSVRVEGDGVVSRRTAVVADGGSVSVTATPPTGRAFLGWEANGEPAGDQHHHHPLRHRLGHRPRRQVRDEDDLRDHIRQRRQRRFFASDREKDHPGGRQRRPQRGQGAGGRRHLLRRGLHDWQIAHHPERERRGCNDHQEHECRRLVEPHDRRPRAKLRRTAFPSGRIHGHRRQGEGARRLGRWRAVRARQELHHQGQFRLGGRRRRHGIRGELQAAGEHGARGRRRGDVPLR